jgi:hypothetical protein
MISAYFRRFRLIPLLAFAGLFALLVVSVPAVFAADFVLDWSAIGFVEGDSSLQTFTNVSGSGVDMTTEVRVLNSSFQDIGIYIPGTTNPNQGMPKPVGDAFSVRDISVSNYPGPTVGYILTKITFSQPVQINDLWMEAFYNWTDGPVRKHLALQAFDENGNGVTPVNWTTYGGSDLVVGAHPANGKPWLRSSYPDTQTNYSGASDIDYGAQEIRELHWYSWGLAANGTLSNLLGSTYLGDVQFSTVPTAVTMTSAEVVSEATAFAAVLPAFLLFGLTTLVLLRRRSVIAA